MTTLTVIISVLVFTGRIRSSGVTRHLWGVGSVCGTCNCCCCWDCVVEQTFFIGWICNWLVVLLVGTGGALRKLFIAHISTLSSVKIRENDSTDILVNHPTKLDISKSKLDILLGAQSWRVSRCILIKHGSDEIFRSRWQPIILRSTFKSFLS